MARWVEHLRRGSGLRLLISLFASTLLILGLGRICQLGLNILLARRLGVADYGQIAFVINLCQILGLVFSLGVPIAAMRFVAGLAGRKDWTGLRGYLSFAVISVVGGSVIAAGAAAIYAVWIAPKGGVMVAWLLVLILPPTVVGLARAAVLRGFHNVFGALFPREILAPLLAMAMVGMASQLSAQQGGVFYSTAYLAAEAVGLYMLWRCIPKETFAEPPSFRVREWLSVSIPIQIQALTRTLLLRADVLFVGLVLGFEAAGSYAVAQRVAQSLSILGRTSTNAISPLIAEAYHAADPKTVLSHTKRAFWLTLALGFPIFLLFAVAAPLIVGLFGEAYGRAASLLVILSVGHLTNSVFKPINQALLMTSFERFQLGLVTGTTLIGLVGYGPIAYYFGLTGVAVCTTLLLVSLNLASYGIGYARLRQQIGRKSNDTAEGTASPMLRSSNADQTGQNSA